MAVKGVFASDSHIVGDRKGDFASSLIQIHPTGTTLLFGLTSGMENIDAVDTIITWFEENHMSGRASVSTGSGGAAGSTIVVDDATQFTAGTILLVEETDELIFITAVTGTTLTIERGFGGSTAADITTSHNVQRIGTAYEEGSSKPTSIANLGYPRFNYMQIFRNPWDITGTAQAISTHTGRNPVAKNRKDAALMHGEDIERSLWFGKKTAGTVNGQPFRTMDGILTQITTNVYTQSSNVTWDDLDNFLQDVFLYNVKGKPNERIAFCGNTVIKVIGKIARLDAVIDIVPGQTDFGLKITKWITPWGDISLMTHPLFNENPVWTKQLHVLHPGAMQLRWLRRTHEDRNDKDGTRAGADSDFGVYTSELSCAYMAERTGGKFTGIDTAAATS